jgi:hypothetical protein
MAVDTFQDCGNLVVLEILDRLVLFAFGGNGADPLTPC